jgi:hypothetical protein
MPSNNAVAPNRAAIIASFLPMITAAVFILYAVGAYFLLFKSKAEMMLPGGSLDAAAFEARAAEDEAYLKKLKDGVMAFEKLNSERRAKVAGIVPVGPDVPGLMVQSDAIGSSNGFVLTAIDAVPDEKIVSASGRRTLRATANFTGGDYSQFKILLASLENGLRVIDPISLVFSAGATNYSLTFNAYYVDAPGTVPVTAKR